MNPDELATLPQSPVVVYVALVIAVLSMITSAFPKLLGPVGKALQEWSTRRRERRIAEEDYQVQDLRRENDYLAMRVSKGVAREHRWAIEANRARVWMRKAFGLLTDQGTEIEPFPELMTPDPPEQKEDSHG